MFTQIFAALEQGEAPDFELLRRHFDLAMTKKLGVIKLPPAFWMQDSKINPRADHLLQVALLLGDRERCDLAVSVLALEISERKIDQTLRQIVQGIIQSLSAVVPPNQKGQIVFLGNGLLSDLPR
ncbi:MAG: hypothetical protein JRF04_05945 [Deltaproteobacteria bacterium]|nr:hypothetical protein [Deltaproteobacteria bacterium]